MTLQFNKQSFLIALSLFLIESLIALYFKAGFIREILGDFLIVFLIFYSISTAVNTNPFSLIVYILAFSFIVEGLQLFKVLNLFNLQENNILQLMVGNTFAFSDLIAYALGCITIIIIEYKIYKLWID